MTVSIPAIPEQPLIWRDRNDKSRGLKHYSKMVYLMLTFDVESCLGKEEISQALPYTLEILSRYPSIRATFNVAAQAVLMDKQAVQQILNTGHEVAAHGYRHDMDWDSKHSDEQEELIVKAKELLQSALGVDVVGWATPRGGKHSADVELLKKHGFLYTRDRSYADYTRFVLPEKIDNFVDIPRFGYDETTFMKIGMVKAILKRTVFKNRFFTRHPDWRSHHLYRYLKNMLDYKMNIEKSYLVTNLHPYHIWNNIELAQAFDMFLSYVSSRNDLSVITMRDFALGLIKGAIIIKDMSYSRTDLRDNVADSEIRVEPRPAPDIALVSNESAKVYSGSLTVEIGLAQVLLLSIGKRTGLLDLGCERTKDAVSYHLKRRQLILDVNLPPYSNSLYSMKRARRKR